MICHHLLTFFLDYLLFNKDQIKDKDYEDSFKKLKQKGNNWIVPDFSGFDARAITGELQKGNLVLEPYGSGKAYKQKPSGGTEVQPGTKIEIWFR